MMFNKTYTKVIARPEDSELIDESLGGEKLLLFDLALSGGNEIHAVILSDSLSLFEEDLLRT